MKSTVLGFLLVSQVMFAQSAVTNVAQRVAEDAIVLDRVAQASKRDLPADLLKRIVQEDIDLLRGKRSDGTYQYATFERFDSGRFSKSFSIQPSEKQMETVEVKGEWVYRVLIEVPGRKLLVRKNRPLWVERVDLEYLGERSTQVERQSIEVKQWLQPGEFRPVDLPVVARQATVRVIASAEPKGGYANLSVALVKADSPYADAVSSVKAVQRALESNDVPSIRAMAQRTRSALSRGTEAAAYIPPPAPYVPPSAVPPPVAVTPAPREATPRETEADLAARLEMQAELQVIEDLLTGSDSERREGLDRLHQLIRRMRVPAP
jgi:hypothetical protein